MINCFIILAAGNSRRFKSSISKAYYMYKGKSLIEHSIDKAKNSKKFKKIVLVINKKDKQKIKKLNIKGVNIIIGGKTRAESSYKALKSIKNLNISKVFIHDAARPNFSKNLINRLFKNLKKNKCVIPGIKPKDSLKIKKGNLFNNLNRKYTYFAQTPQAFDYKEIFKLFKKNTSNITDDSSLFINAKKMIKIIDGENENKKITYKSDLYFNRKTNFGIGFDIHRLELKRKLFLGGIKIPYHSGLKGHSDGDVVIHALIDALLGACKFKDIGTMFSNKMKKFKNIRSTKMLKKVLNLIKKENFYINNIDINIIAEEPQIKKYRNRITKSISSLCEINEEKINVKGKTAEKLGLIGKEKAIASEVIASVVKYV